MLNSKWSKIRRDLLEQKTKISLVMIAMVIGIFGFTLVANSYTILAREMNVNYIGTNPSSATLWINGLTEEQLSVMAQLEQVKTLEVRDKVIARVLNDEKEWKSIHLFVIDDFSNIKLDTFTPDKGQFPAKSDEILIERAALRVVKAQIGDKISIKIPGTPAGTLPIVGTVHAPGLAPAWMEGYAYGYITRDTFLELGGSLEQSEVKLLFNDSSLDQDEIKTLVYHYKTLLEKQGVNIERIEVPIPNQHPHENQLMLLLYLMELFGVLAILLSSVLVATMISSLLEQQVRQIGVLKAIGAGENVIMQLYLGMILILAVVATSIGLPLGLMAGRSYAQFSANLLNFKIYSDQIPTLYLAAQILISLLIPILAALAPIIKSSRITVRKALSDYGLASENFKKESPGWTAIIPRTVGIALRNTFRKKKRLLLTVLVLAISGAGFIIALNIYSSMYNTVDVRVASDEYNLQINLSAPTKIMTLSEALSAVDGITSIDYMSGAQAQVAYDTGTFGNQFALRAPTLTKEFTAPTLYEGRFLSGTDQREIVINQRVQSLEPQAVIGSTVELKINGTLSTWTVVGVSEELIGFPYAFVNQKALQAITKTTGYATTLSIATTDSDVDQVTRSIESKFQQSGIEIKDALKLSEFEKAIKDHLLIIASFLIAMSSLVLLVGGLGLGTTITINVLDRTKEIGVLKAIGAGNRVIVGIIMIEGLVIGLISYCVSVILSWPLSQYVSYQFGIIFFEAPLKFAPSPLAYLAWFQIVVIFSLIASASPSLRAVNSTIAKTLAYE